MTIELAKNPIHHNRTKHIDIQYHFIREKLTDNTVKFRKINITNQVADILTKVLSRERFSYLFPKIGLMC